LGEDEEEGIFTRLGSLREENAENCSVEGEENLEIKGRTLAGLDAVKHRRSMN
jgi:hypothetical protein